MLKKLNLIALLSLLSLVAMPLQAQTVKGTAKTEGYQVVDPGFEDWSQTFDGQPALGGGSTGENTGKGLWYGSNVYKDLVGGVYGQVVYKTDDRHSGNSAAKLVDTRVGVKIGTLEIKETSPSWVTLGTPWAYLNGTDTNSATAGTDGGIKFTARPDTMSVWIKRVSNGLENINLVYYSWSGTAKGSKYKNKGGGCSSTSHTDEESDIRTQFDPNICGTDQQAKQIADGLIQTKAQYNNWTQIKVPITYYYNDIPEKMNIILSASTYPEGRATGPLYEGNYMIVDDLELIYSSKIEYLYFDGEPFSKFKKDVYEYNVILGEEATVNDIPKTITAKRNGRDLLGSEISVNRATKLGDPTTITVKAEDGSSTTTYTIYFKATESTNSRLSNIYVNGTAVPSFNGYLTDYNVELPYGTTGTPVITFDKGHQAQVVEVTSCGNFPCKATVKVTAENKSYVTTYNLNLSVGKLSDNTLQDILVGGKSIPSFKPTTNTYVVELPLGTTQEPTIEAVSKYAKGDQNIVITRNGLNGTSTIVVTPPAGTSRTYKITYKITESSNSHLENILVGGKSIPGFESSKTQYDYTLPVGTEILPAITWVKGDAYQDVKLENEGVNGTSKIIVTAQNGEKTIYRISFEVVKSSVSTLKNIFIGGVALAEFSADVKNYEYNVAATATTRPVVTWETGDAYQIVSKSETFEKGSSVAGTTKLTVRAQDGSSSVYTITFTQTLSSNSKLADLSVAGYTLSPEFNPEVTAYTCALKRGTTVLPAISYVKGDETQVVRIDESGVNGVAKITVKPQVGDNTVYTISFSVAVSSDATLKNILVGGESIEGFESSNLEYSILLPAGTTTLPAIEAVKNDDAQRVIINRGSVSGLTTIQVIAEDGTSQTYKLNFSVEKSANATLQNIYVGGAPLADFDPEVLNYTYILADDADKCPELKAEGFPGQTISIVTPLVYGTATIEVVPEEGAKNVYTVLFTTAKSSNNLLSEIKLDGESLDGFNAETNNYNIVLPEGTTSLPVITYTKGAETQQVQVVTAGVNGTTYLYVVAEDGSLNTYTINFSVKKSSDASLSGIFLNGSLIEGFASENYEYNVELPFGTTELPVLTYTKANDAAHVVATIPSLVGEAKIVVESEDGLNSLNYKVNFYVSAQNNATLNNIFVNGVAIEDFASDKYEYEIEWMGGTALPTLTYEKADATQQVIVKNNNWAGCIFVVKAQDGTTSEYNVTYKALNSDVALLSDIMFYNADEETYVSIEGFDANTFNYDFVLPRLTKMLPSIQLVAGSKGQRITIKEGSVESATIIEVLAQDGVTTATYTLNFTTEKSSVATLSNIMVGGNDIDGGFDPQQFNYEVSLPYGTEVVPVVEYEKSVAEQTVIVSETGLYGATRLLVIAEDGVSSSTYTINYKVAEVSGKPNKPAFILIDKKSIALQDGVYDYEVEIPYGVTQLPAIKVEKLYPEQEVRIVEKPKSYSLTLASNQAGVEDVTYNISFRNAEPKALLTGISAKTLYPAFSPDVTKYVALVDNESDFVATTDEEINEILTDGSTTNKKVIKVKNIANSLDTRTYTVYLHYNGDVIPNGEFTDWTSAESVGSKPTGWKVPGDYVTSDDDKPLGISIGSSAFSPGELVKAESNNLAVLNTVRVYYFLGGWFPGMMSLSEMSISMGNQGKTSTSLSGKGIEFRNTPDNYEVSYKLGSSSNIDNNFAHYGIKFTTEGDPLEISGDKCKSTFNNTEKTDSDAINWNGISSPTHLNIWFCAGKSLNASDYGYYKNAFTDRKQTICSTMKVDYIRFSYNSAISAIKVNGVSAAKSGNAFTANIDADYVGRPQIDIIGEVEDQAYDVVWTEESENLYKADITSYAEDGTATKYTLVVNIVPRELSTDNNLVALSVNGTDIYLTSGSTELVAKVPASLRQYPDVAAKLASEYATIVVEGNEVENILNVKVIAENSDEKVYSVKLEKEYSADVTLKNLTVEGYELEFNPATLTYNVDLGLAEIPAIAYEKQLDGQTVELSVADTTTIKVIAENGVDTQSYKVVFAREKAPTSALLSGLAVLNGEPITFDANTFEYATTLTEGDFAQIYYAKAFAADSIKAVQEDNIATIEVFNGTELRNTYTLTYNKPLSTNVLLANILVNGVGINEFDPLNDHYNISYTKGDVVDIEPVLAEEGQSVEVEFVEAEQTFIITVFAEAYTTPDDSDYTKEYRVTLTEIKDNNAFLAGIYVDGVLIEGFSSDVTNYDYTVVPDMPKWNAPAMPSITAEAGAEGQIISIEQNGLNAKTYITVLAADGFSGKVYELNIIEGKSSYVYLNSIAVNYEEVEDFDPTVEEYEVSLPIGANAPVISYEMGDAYQTVSGSQEGNVYKLMVTAENGESFTYNITFKTQYTGISTLAGITLDGVQINNFLPETLDYKVELPTGTKDLPVIAVLSGAEGQTVQILPNGVNGETQIIVTADDNITTSTYTISFSVIPSKVATLDNILIDGENLEGFNSEELNYTVTLPVGTREWPIVSWVAGDEYQTVNSTEEVTDLYNKVVKITVQAQDSNVEPITYTVNFVVEKSSNNTLNDIQIDNVSIEEFDALTNYYVVELPIGTTEYPNVTYTEGDAYQTIEQTVNENVVSINVVAEDGSARTYKVEFVVLHSSNADLAGIYVDYALIEKFDPAVTEYNYVLPYGTTEMPVVEYEAGDMWQTITYTPCDVIGDYIINVLAEDGENSKTYIIHFSVAKSDNALLASILVEGEEMPNFDSEVFDYTYSLPYGETSVPSVSYVKAMEPQVVTLVEATSVNEATTITVVAEDGVTRKVYTINWANKESDNANLLNIYVDGKPLEEFDPQDSEYTVVLPYGTTELPEVTVEYGDADQTAEVEMTETQAIISVKAQDGTPNEYIITFEIEKSAENRLKDIFVKGALLEGFNPEVMEYEIVYPNGTPVEEVATLEDLTYNVFDPIEQVTLMNDSMRLMIQVIAENGEMRMYVINQSIALSNNTKLDDILINGKSIEGFDPEELEYTYILPFGSLAVPEDIIYLSSDTTQTIVLSVNLLGKPTEIFVTAEDGTKAVYRIHFVVDEFDPTTEPTVDNVCITSLPDGKWRFTTNCSNVSLLISTLDGKLMLLTDLELVDVNIPNICSEEANGFVFDAPEGQILVYYFKHMNKRTIHSGKFRTTINQ